jgi:hypothetical protein
VRKALETGFSAFYQCGPEPCFHWNKQCEYYPLCQAQTVDTVEILMRQAYVQREWHPYDLGEIKEPLVEIKL